MSAGIGCCSGQSPEESLHATGCNRRNRIHPYMLLQVPAQAQTKEIQLQGCLGQTQTQSTSDSTEEASPSTYGSKWGSLCAWSSRNTSFTAWQPKHPAPELAGYLHDLHVSIYYWLVHAWGQSFLFGQRHLLWQSTSHLLCWRSNMTPDDTTGISYTCSFEVYQWLNDNAHTKTPSWHVSCFSKISFGNSIYSTALSESDVSAYQADGFISQNQTFNSLKVFHS